MLRRPCRRERVARLSLGHVHAVQQPLSVLLHVAAEAVAADGHELKIEARESVVACAEALARGRGHRVRLGGRVSAHCASAALCAAAAVAAAANAAAQSVLVSSTRYAAGPFWQVDAECGIELHGVVVARGRLLDELGLGLAVRRPCARVVLVQPAHVLGRCNARLGECSCSAQRALRLSASAVVASRIGHCARYVLPALASVKHDRLVRDLEQLGVLDLHQVVAEHGLAVAQRLPPPGAAAPPRADPRSSPYGASGLPLVLLPL
mmetsp:Transcript_5158/g.15735  ORF Transcript_5158/g.15735 Transcript_5158/m.15735 type:complete len:265 (+) Transcript_5158:539-1333(+)